MARQKQFLDVIARDEAERRFREAVRPAPLGQEQVALRDALGRVLARDAQASVDVPSFDRSNLDGFAVQAKDTYGATEQSPRELRLLTEIVASRVVPRGEVGAGTAMTIATGGMVPRGADAVVMIEHTDVREERLLVTKAVTPGFGVAFTGTDIARGEIALRKGDRLTSRETGVLAAIGATEVAVWRRPRVAIISTGDEIIAPGEPMEPGLVYDSNATIIADAVTELGAESMVMGIVRDDLNQLRRILNEALADHDVVLMSGGTSKGAGDLSYHAVSELADPGIVAHGVALKPGKPICLAVSAGKPVVILPGFPTSAIFTFHEFVAPVIRQMSGQLAETAETIRARLAVKINSDVGRTEYVLVGLLPCSQQPAAYPMGRGSGSVTTFSRADGFITIGRRKEIVDAGEMVDVQLLGRGLRAADLVVVGSHCVGMDFLLSELQSRGFETKFLAVGSTAGLEAAKRAECDVAGVHLLDEASGEYNRPFLNEDLDLIPGYGRAQGVVHRRADKRFEGRAAVEAIEAVADDDRCMMINRNQGSGTRILIDQQLRGRQPPGYAVQARNHNAVAAAVAQGRADWGVAIEIVAQDSPLGFLPLADEQYDLIVPHSRRDRPAVAALVALLDEPQIRARLDHLGLRRRSSEE